MADPAPDNNNSFLYFIAALVVTLIAWPMTLYSAHSAVFRSGEGSGSTRIIFSIVVLVIALVSTWLAVFFGGRSSSE